LVGEKGRNFRFESREYGTAMVGSNETNPLVLIEWKSEGQDYELKPLLMFGFILSFSLLY